MNEKMVFTDELLKKARKCNSAEELAALAKENGKEITGEEAKRFFERLNPADGKIPDAELDNVTGGGVCHYGDTVKEKGLRVDEKREPEKQA